MMPLAQVAFPGLSRSSALPAAAAPFSGGLVEQPGARG
jgi:hypothetical protein